MGLVTERVVSPVVATMSFGLVACRRLMAIVRPKELGLVEEFGRRKSSKEVRLSQAPGWNDVERV